MRFVVRFVVHFIVRPVVTWVAILLAALAAVAAAVLFALRREQRRWGIDASDAVRVMPGDDLVADAGIVDTRSLVIDAPPAAVWPWLAQLGYERGGWYSYDLIDMKGRSAEGILPGFQDLAEGDLVPTHPGGGFVARVVQPDRALVLYLDDALVRDQAEGARASQDATGGRAPGTSPSLPGCRRPERWAASPCRTSGPPGRSCWSRRPLGRGPGSSSASASGRRTAARRRGWACPSWASVSSP